MLTEWNAAVRSDGPPDATKISGTKRIGILTLHSGMNEGAILQAYALSTGLRAANPGWTVEIVDQRYPSHLAVYGPLDNDRKRALAGFIDERLPLSRERFVEDRHDRAFDFIRRTYDGLIVGSDELWKVDYRRRFLGLRVEQTNPWSPAFPNAYWPDESIRVPKIAYAASVGGTDWRTIPPRDKRRMAGILRDFSLLGVRDDRTRSFLSWLGSGLGERAEWVPDPSFLLDLKAVVQPASLRSKLERFGVDFLRPRLAVALTDSAWLKRIIERFRTKGFQIIGLSDSNGFSDVELFREGFTSLEWLGIFGQVDACLSQRMHACIACILNGTPFAALDFYGNRMDEESKLKDLMRAFNLLDFHFYYSEKEASFDRLAAVCERVMDGSWPTDAVSDTRRRFQARAGEFVKKVETVVSRGS
ncbi:MAG: polysaccharide pyruvyl transferase family protein [Nitrospirae bacterium]|nr:polysaccharide pyruvyl transferase family protein [Nitrospirota bacterium]